MAALALTGCGNEQSNETSKLPSQEVPADNVVHDPPAAPAEALPARLSVFTPLEATSCKMIEENRDEGSYWRRQCPGPADYSVEWTESDLRQGLEVLKDGSRTDLQMSAIVAEGAFNRLGPRIEWRGNKGSPPDRLVVRYFVADGAAPAKPDKSLLAVASLEPSPCIIAIVSPGPGQSDEARRIADEPARPCLGSKR